MTIATPVTTADRVREALRGVLDPELGYNIVDLGLVYDVDVSDDGVARIVMTTTTAGCPATAFLRNGAGESARAVPGIAAAEVAMTYEPRWTPAMMTDDAKRHLGILDGED